MSESFREAVESARPSTNAAGPRDPGVSIKFWAASLKALAKQHEERNPTSLIDEIRHHLAMAEFYYLQMPMVEKKPSKRKEPKDA